MVAETLTLSLSDLMARRLHRAAELSHQSVDQFVTRVVSSVLTATTDLPAEAADEIAALQLLSDRDVRLAARPMMSAKERRRLTHLNHLAGERQLTEAEAAEQQTLLDAYGQAVVRRAAALAVLEQRGISPLAKEPSAA